MKLSAGTYYLTYAGASTICQGVYGALQVEQTCTLPGGRSVRVKADTVRRIDSTSAVLTLRLSTDGVDTVILPEIWRAMRIDTLHYLTFASIMQTSTTAPVQPGRGLVVIR